MKPAIFLDRDGTLIEHVHYLSKPEDVRIVNGGAQAVQQLREGGFAIIIVTNQSAVGRGMLTEADLAEVHRVMCDQLANEGASVDGIYYCTHVPTIKDQSVIEHPDRKPAPGMLIRAAQESNLDLSRSWMVGDSRSDVLAGHNAGCLGSILVRTGYGKQTEQKHPELRPVVDDLPAAANLILKQHLESPSHGSTPS